MTLSVTDEELARRAGEGDEEAFAGLVRRHAGTVLALCRRLVQDPHEAEDLAQEALLKAFEGLPGYDPGRAFRPWLLRIAHNACVDALRRRKAWAPLGDAPAPQGGAPLARDHAGELQEAIAALPGRYRAVLHGKYSLGLGAAEIGEALDMSPGNVRVCLHRAIRTLRERLSP